MYCKVILACLLAVATATSYKQYSPPAAAPESEPEVNIDYKMSMYVQDDPSYNYQTRQESKEGKIIKGEYTVLEPTGELRVVKYYADENGFHADVQNQAGYSKPYKAPEPAYPQAAPAYKTPEQAAPAYAQASAQSSYGQKSESESYSQSSAPAAAPKPVQLAAPVSVPHLIFFQSAPKAAAPKPTIQLPIFNSAAAHDGGY